jgi:hypothetical protein
MVHLPPSQAGDHSERPDMLPARPANSSEAEHRAGDTNEVRSLLVVWNRRCPTSSPYPRTHKHHADARDQRSAPRHEGHRRGEGATALIAAGSGVDRRSRKEPLWLTACGSESLVGLFLLDAQADVGPTNTDTAPSLTHTDRLMSEFGRSPAGAEVRHLADCYVPVSDPFDVREGSMAHRLRRKRLRRTALPALSR